MSGNESRVRWPDGASLSVPFPYGRIGGTYYWNPGSPAAPRLTLTRSLGMPGAGAHAVFLRQGMTSNDTLGMGIGGNVSTILPSVSLNGTIPDDENYIPRPWKSRVTTVEAGIGTPNASPAITATYTPQQIADFLTKYGLVGLDLLKRVPAPGLVGPATPAMGPDDELSPFARTLSSGVGTVGTPTVPPIRYLSSRSASPLGNGMDDWKSSAESYSQQPAQSAPSPQEPGGLLGLLQDYMRNNLPPYH